MKDKIFIDFDETIVATRKAFCATYNELFKDVEDYVFADWIKNNSWDFDDVCPLLSGRQDVNKLFCYPQLFTKLEFIDENMETVLKKLQEQYELIICSKGTHGNIALKSMWIHGHLPFISESILIADNNANMGKGNIQMQNSIIIDDNMANLDSSNASTKICFGEVLKWNEDWNGIRTLNSLELFEILDSNQ